MDLRPLLRHPISTAVAVVSDPIEAWIRFHEQFVAHRERRAPAGLYSAEPDWEEQLGSFLNLSPDSEILAEFWDLWDRVIWEMGAKGVQAGPASFKGWNDGDAALVRPIWSLTRCMRPKSIVETGVGHGVTSRLILEALERNGSGRLWSIDRPPVERKWREQTGLAVGEQNRHRWSHVHGSSRRRLPRVLSELGTIDLFVHDSLHSERNVRFEVDRAWAVLRPGGAIVVDDIDMNRGFHTFRESFSDLRSLVCEAEPLLPDLGRFNKKGLFGIILKASSGTSYERVPLQTVQSTSRKP